MDTTIFRDPVEWVQVKNYNPVFVICAECGQKAYNQEYDLCENPGCIAFCRV